MSRNRAVTCLRMKEPGEVPSSPLPSGGVAPMSQPMLLFGGDSPVSRPPPRLGKLEP